jgi:hypothetical protein
MMAIYVDDMRAPFGRMKMCHMMADTSDELMFMARKLGLRIDWLQKAGTAQEHFDVSLTKRAEAVRNGAQEVTRRELGRLILKKQGR